MFSLFIGWVIFNKKQLFKINTSLTEKNQAKDKHLLPLTTVFATMPQAARETHGLANRHKLKPTHITSNHLSKND